MPELATEVTSLLRLVVSSSPASGPSVGSTQFEFYLPFPVAVGVTVL